MVPDSNNKDVIFYHRAYRKLPSPGLIFSLVEISLLFLFFAVIIFYVFPQLSSFTSSLSKYILSFVMPPNTLVISSEKFMSKNFYIIARIGKFPSTTFLFFTMLATVLAAVLSVKTRKIPKSVGVWIFYVCILNLLSCLFFLYAPDRFPYDIKIFSDLYMRTQITVWFFIPLIIPLALSPFPTNVLMKGGIITLILLYSIVFGCVRYIVFFYILAKYSYVFMPVLFFALGPLLDFVYIIGLYSFFVSFIAVKMKGNLTKWQWSY
ncbi:MAG: hypothetical protein JW957_02960 [Candidatus Omnitrophica bacterium]|nr:hypothetical protein [Candidatus Omnitrophota bacterium]